MKKQLLKWCAVVGLCLLSTSASAQSSAAKWSFRSRAEVVPALRQTRGDLRKTYEVILNAARQGYSSSTLKFYEGIVSGKEFDATAKDSVAYVFAFDTNYSLKPSTWKRDKNRVPTKSSYAYAQTFRERAKYLYKTSAEASVMRILPNLTTGPRKEAYQDGLRAVRLDPKWADAYFWLGQAIEGYALTFDNYQSASHKATKIRLAKAEIRAYDMAEKLDPSIGPYLSLYRFGAYGEIGGENSVRLMRVYLNKHLRDFPDWCARSAKARGLTEQQYRDKLNRQIDEVQEKIRSS